MDAPPPDPRRRHNDPTSDGPSSSIPGISIGPYRLLERIGEGGMGEVWLAEQTRPVQRKVALKVIKPGMDTSRVVARFEAERQALALMSHPSIAQVFDAGATREGRPYFAMEYVPGEAITDYCQRHRLDLRQRIAIFLEVCDAVQHAHQKGVIHRDLKPSNVLVTRRDDRPVPKVIDFGVAKATNQLLTDRTLHTERGVLIGTLEYMSPEQAEMSGLDVDTRTDVYALGVILYELLTGALPFEPRELREKSLDEIRRTIREVDPPRPSTRVTTTLGARPDGRPRDAVVAQARELRGDLDWIVLRALEKERTRRYGSASDFAADLQRYLHNEPVSARPPSVTYRFGKFVRRHRLAVSAAALVMLLSLGFGAAMAVQARQLARERDRAQAAQATAEQVTAFLLRMFEASDPSESLGDTVTARELLATGVERVNLLEGQPEVQARLLDAMGRVHQSLGRFEEAQSLLTRALEIRRVTLGPAHPAVAESLTHLGGLATLRGRHDEAEQYLRDALGLHEEIGGRHSAEAATDLHGLGAALFDQGRREEARQLFDEALTIRRAVLAPDDPDIAESLSGLAYAASGLGDFDEMERRYREALDVLRRAFGDRHPRIALGLNNLAAALDNRGQYDEAARLHREALEMRRQIFGDEHPAVATSLNNLSTVLQKQGNYAEAEPLIRQVVALRRKLLGDDHPATGTGLNNLGVLLFRSGRPKEAEPYLREARALTARRLPENHPVLLAMDVSMAGVIAAQGRDAEAETLFTRTHAARVRTLGPEHPDIANGLLSYGRFLASRRRFAEARSRLLDSYAMRLKLLGDAHPDTVASARELIAVHRALGETREADALARVLP